MRYKSDGNEAEPLPPFEWLAAFDEIQEPVFVHDEHYRVLRCNAAYAAHVGLPMEDIVGRPYWLIFPRSDGPLRHCLEAVKHPFSAETSELTAEGDQIFISHDITARRPTGEFWYSRHMMENVSARREHEEADKRRAQFDEAIIAGVPGVLAVVDDKHRLVRWNDGFAALVGRAAGGLAGADLASVVAPPRLRDGIAAKLEEAFAHGAAAGAVRFAGAADETDFILAVRRLESDGSRFAACVGLGRQVAEAVDGDLAGDMAFSDAIIESAPGPYYVIDQQSNLVRWNRRLAQVAGKSDEELAGSSILATIHQDDRDLAAAKFLAAFAMGYAQMEVRVPTPGEGLRVFLKTARRFELGGVPYVTGFCVDITERRKAENALTEEKAFTDALVNSVPGAFYVLDSEGNYHAWNSYLNRLTGLCNEALRRRSHLMTIAEEDRPLAAAAMRRAFESGYSQAELHVLTRDRGIRLYYMTARRFQVGDAVFLVGVGIDTTDRMQRIHQLEEEARTDPLTRVPNRSHFLSLAAQEFARSRRYGHPLSLWMLDVDHFKNVNDAYGHHAGDLALQTLGATSRQILRDWDIMGRMGGEEFAVLLPETDATQALLVAERLRQKVASTEVPVEPGRAVHLTVSIGVATMHGNDGDVEHLIDRADQALLEAKRTGRDKVSVSDTPPRP
ncbi:MAG TPA: diguanylate cyclase [Rhodocyclaceae bacterium]